MKKNNLPNLNNSKILKHACSTPLTNILINLELAHACLTNSKVKLNYKYYLEQASLAAQYLKSVLDTVDNQPGKIENFLLKQAIQEVVALSQRKRERIYLISYLKLKNKVMIKGNKFYFQEALICLLNNAFEAYQKNARNKAVILSAKQDQKKVEINITDGGQGINWLKQKLIPFFSLSDKKNHRGIGLDFAKQTIETHFHGKLKIFSKKGKGTRVKIIFNLASTDNQNP
ncbi:MAG: HAMP domain-containing sensor histidine kinase [Candidatus Woesebacteria bacterium]|jgi:K+-sensing histidine kinase KdpD